MDLVLEGIVLAIGRTSIPKYSIDLQDKIKSGEDKESETNTLRRMDTLGDIFKVNAVSNKTLIGIPLGEDNEYFSGSTSCKDRSREEAKDTGNTSTTGPESGRMVTSPFGVPYYITFPNVLGVGSEYE